jgi:hypothetical protein
MLDHKRNFYPLLIGHLINLSFSFFVPLIFVVLTESYRYESATALKIISISYTVGAIFLPFVGKLLDAGKTTLFAMLGLVSSLVGVSGFFALQLSPTRACLCVSLLLFGSGLYSVGISRVLEAKEDPLERAHGAFLNYMIANVGMAISATIAMFFLRSSQRTLVIVDIATFLISFAILFRHLGSGDYSISNDNLIRQSKSNFFAPRSFFAFITTCLIGLPLFANFSYIPAVYKSHGLDSVMHHSLTVLISSVVVAICFAFFREYFKRMSAFAGLSFGSILIVGGMAMVQFVLNIYTNILITTIWTVGEVMAMIALNHLLFAAFDKSEYGLAAGLKAFAFRTTLVIAPLLSIAAVTQKSMAASLTIVFAPILGLIISRMKLHIR